MNRSPVTGEQARTHPPTHPHTFPALKKEGQKHSTILNPDHQAAVLMKSISHICHPSVTVLPPLPSLRPPVTQCDWLFIILIPSLSESSDQQSVSPLSSPSSPLLFSHSALRLSIHLSAPRLSNSLIGLCLSSLRAIIDGGVIVSSSLPLKPFLQVSTALPFKACWEWVESQELLCVCVLFCNSWER